MDNINTESNSYRVAVKCQEKSGFRDLVIIANFGLRNETIWPGFLWCLTIPSGETYVHYVASRPNTLKALRL